MNEYIKTMTSRELVDFTKERFDAADYEMQRFIVTTITNISLMERFLEERGLLTQCLDVIEENCIEIH